MTETLLLWILFAAALVVIGVAVHDVLTDRPGRRHEPPRSHPRDPFSGARPL
ncbi:hypothetical protein [Nocardioides aurantiacus]|uniref:Uncharacterized protein n=1 Tax=Nocardioides aurantiacus TaxID=86796 RepID=A0A3N2CW28_9ACTN|nr:hypothetical protein [Nocardioides aurantiacus]ROR91404.1 hypothetical protein EDD33_2270 [Nocardioides aurantiacus]